MSQILRLLFTRNIVDFVLTSIPLFSKIPELESETKRSFSPETRAAEADTIKCVAKLVGFYKRKGNYIWLIENFRDANTKVIILGQTS